MFDHYYFIQTFMLPSGRAVNRGKSSRSKMGFRLFYPESTSRCMVLAFPRGKTRIVETTA